MRKTYIIAIDPGKNGGIVALYNKKIISMAKMPPTPKLLYEHLLYLGLPYNHKGELSLNIENVHSMPTDGSKQAFTFGRGLGQIEGVIASMGLYERLQRISPHTWMKYYGITKYKGETRTSFKNRLKQQAIQTAKLYTANKSIITLATCDALLIAHYAQKNQKENQNENQNEN